MKKIFQHFIFLILSCSTIATYAASQPDTLQVYLTNATKDSFFFERVVSSMPGNQFSINKIEVKPGETAIVTVDKLLNDDINGTVAFVNTKGENYMLHVLDQEQVHSGQSIFDMYGKTIKTSLESKIPNDKVGPRYLMYTKASLRVGNIG